MTTPDSAAEVASLEPAVGAELRVGDQAHHGAGSSDGAAETPEGGEREGNGPTPFGPAIALRHPRADDPGLQACVDRHPSGRTKHS